MYPYRIQILILSIFLCSCNQSPRLAQYDEVVIEPSQQSMSQDPHRFLSQMPMSMQGVPGTDDSNTQEILKGSMGGISLQWDTPMGWVETKGDGLRMATFKTSDADPIECSIVSLSGMAGGMEANITRWMSQIQLPGLPPEELSAFMKKQETIKSKGGLTGTIYNFTTLQASQSDQEPSMIATIFDVDGTSVFVKMTGSKNAVKNQLETFKRLCASITEKP